MLTVILLVLAVPVIAVAIVFAAGFVRGLRDPGGSPAPPEFAAGLARMTLEEVDATQREFDARARALPGEVSRQDLELTAVPAGDWAKLRRRMRRRNAKTVGDLGIDQVQWWSQRLAASPPPALRMRVSDTVEHGRK